jgi:hypothetical protein
MECSPFGNKNTRKLEVPPTATAYPRNIKLYTEEELIVFRRKRLDALNKHRLNRQQRAVEYKGGKCQICGYSKCSRALEFHHIDPNAKEFGISSKAHSTAWDKLCKELDKCALLCANCHREVHAGIIDVAIAQ